MLQYGCSHSITLFLRETVDFELFSNFSDFLVSFVFSLEKIWNLLLSAVPFLHSFFLEGIKTRHQDNNNLWIKFQRTVKRYSNNLNKVLQYFKIYWDPCYNNNWSTLFFRNSQFQMLTVLKHGNVMHNTSICNQLIQLTMK